MDPSDLYHGYLTEQLKLSSFQEQRLAQKWMTKLDSHLSHACDYRLAKEKMIEIIESYSAQAFNAKPIYIDHLINDLKYKTFKEIKDKYLTCHHSTLAPKESTFLQLLFTQTLVSKSYQQFLEEEIKDLRAKITQEQAKWIPVKRDEMLRLLIYLEKEKRLLTGTDFKCDVLDVRELYFYLLQEAIGQSIPMRFQCLIRNFVHYTGLDISISQNGTKTCLVLDAYNDDKHLPILSILKELGFNIYVAGHEPNLQLDMRSCSIFSLDHVIHSSKNEKLFEQLPYMKGNKEKDVTYIPWAEFDPCMVKNSQNLKFLDEYTNQDSPKLKAPYKTYPNFKAYLSTQLDPSRSSTSTFQVNTHIEKKLASYNKKVKEFFERMDKVKADNEILSSLACSYPLSKKNRSFNSFNCFRRKEKYSIVRLNGA